MADELSWNPVTVDMNQQYEILGSGIDTDDRGFIPIDEIIAENVADTVKLDFSPDLQNDIFNQLKTGEWQGFNLMPEFKDLSTSERALSNDDIIKLFAKSPEGKVFEEGTESSGFGRDILPQAGAFGAFVGGAKAGAQVVSKLPVPPIAKFLVPAVTGLASSVAAYKGGEELTSLMIGDENPILPGTRAAYARGKTAAGVIPWLALPFTISKNVSFGAAQYLDNLAYLNLSKTGAKEVAPKNIKILSGMEKLLTGVGETARKRPIPFGLVEAVAGTSQTILGGSAEQDFPQQVLPRLGYEAGGSLIPGIIGSVIIERTAGIASGLSKGLKNLKTEGLKGLDFVRRKREYQGIQKILQIIEAEGEDVNEIIRKLSDPKLLTDEKGRPIEMTAALKTGSPALMAIEAALAQTNRGLGKQQKTAVTQAGTAVRNLITALAASGDKDALKEAARLSESLFSGALADRLKTRSLKVLEAFKNLRGDSPVVNSELGEALYRSVSELLDQARGQEKLLWRSVEDQDITNFARPDGETSTIPNFIEAWSKSMPQEEVAKKYYLQTGRLGPLNEFVEKMSLSLGIKTPPVKSSSKILNLQAQKSDMETQGLLASYRKLMDEIDDPDKIRLYNLGDKYVYDESLSNDDNVIGLAEQLIKKETGKFGSASARSDYNKVIAYAKKNRQINSLIAKEQKGIVQDLTKEKMPVSVNSLVEMRSIALSIGAAQTAVGDRNSARIAFDFANALLKDINSVPEGQDLAYDTARAYSKSLNDVFTRAFAGDILAKDKTRSTRLAPELLSSTMLRGGAEPTLLRIKQIGAVGKFAKDQDLPQAEGLANSVSGTLEMMLRNARVASIDPETGEVNTKLLKRWMDQNKEVLDSQVFQGLRDDLNDVNSANVLLGDTRIKNKKFKKKLDDQFYFSKLLPKLNGAESPTYAAGIAVRGKNPIRDINNLVKLAQASDDPKAAMNGLKSSILESALTHSGGTSQGFSVRALADSLFSNMPNAKMKTNLSDFMVSKGIMTEPEAKTMKSFVTELVKLEAADEANTLGGLLEDGLSPMADLYLRLAGAQVGSTIGKIIPGRSGTGQGLIESGAGVKAMMSIFRDVPASMKMDVMGDLMTNPTKLANMLQTSTDEKIQLRIAERISRYLQQMGFKPVRRITPSVVRELSPEDEDEATEVEERDEFIDQIQQKINKNKVSSVEPSIQTGIPTTQVASSQPFLSGLNTAPAGGGGSSAASAPTDRSKYASLFPNDIVSGMIQGAPVTMELGGEVLNLKEAPETDDLRSLTLEEFEEATLKHLLDLQDKKNEAYDKYTEPTKYIRGSFFGGTGPQNNSIFLEEAQKIEQEMRDFGIDRQKALSNYEDALREGKMVSMRSAKDIEEGNVIVRGFPDYLVNPVKNMRFGGDPSQSMGLETDVAAQQSIQSSLQDTGSDNNTSFSPPPMLTTALDRIRSIPTTFQQNLNYNTPNAFAGLPSLNVGGFNVGLGPVGGNLGITATKTFAGGGPVRYMANGGPSESSVGDDSDDDSTNADPSQDMGMDSNVQDMQSIQDSLDPSGDTSNVPSLDYNIQKGLVTNYIKNLLKTNQVRDVQRDKFGRITGVTSVHNPFDPTQLGVSGIMGLIGQAVPGLSTISNVVSGLFGPATTYTGYNPKSTKDPNDNGNDNELIRKKIIPIGDLTPLTSRQIYNQNPNQYTLRTR